MTKRHKCKYCKEIFVFETDMLNHRYTVHYFIEMQYELLERRTLEDFEKRQFMQE